MFCPTGVSLSTRLRYNSLPGKKVQMSGRRVGELSNVADGMDQAAGFSLMPSVNLVPLTTSASSGDPFNDRQPFEALSISLNTIVRHADRLPLPFVLS